MFAPTSLLIFPPAAVKLLSNIHNNKNTVFIRSDNPSHFKSAENFGDLQEIDSCVVLWNFQSCKDEIDSCGGHLKNAVRRAIAMGARIHSDMESVEYLMSHFDGKTDLSYVARLHPDDLRNEQEKYLYIDKTVHGSDGLLSCTDVSTRIELFSCFQ